jgi:hypothetical protein
MNLLESGALSTSAAQSTAHTRVKNVKLRCFALSFACMEQQNPNIKRLFAIVWKAEIRRTTIASDSTSVEAFRARDDVRNLVSR